MFRAAFHTGYTPPKVLRLSKAQLDGACSDKRYADDFFIDLIFEECSAAMASKHLISSPEKGASNSGHVKFANDTKTNENCHNEAAARRMGGTIVGSDITDGSTVKASQYDSMLHRDSRFWDVISERRDLNRKNSMSESFDKEDNDEKISEALPFYGPTIGRRREFAEEVKSDRSSTEQSMVSNDVTSHRSMQSFSIGGELDFRVDEEKSTPTEQIPSPKEKGKDDLMEALMAIDDDIDATDGDRIEDDLPKEPVESADTEEIVFDEKIDEVVSTETPVQKTGEMTEDQENSNENQEENTISEIETKKSKQSSSDASLVKVEELELDDDSGDFDFEDDDEELQDLENFLTNTKT